MLYAFIDESYTRDRYYVSAFVIPEDQIASLEAAIDAAGKYAQTFGVPEGAEFHAHQIMSGQGDWKTLQRKHRAAVAVYKRALTELIAIPGAKMFIEGVDIARLNTRYKYPQPPHRVTLRHLLEAVDRYATLHKEEVTVIADEVQDQIAHAERAESYQVVGTGGFRSSKLTTIQMPITFGESHQSPGLQAADLIVYLFRRLDGHTETNAKAARAVEELWGTLRPIWSWVRRWNP